MSKKNPNRPMRGDFIEIVEPKFFVRCGYPLTIKSVREMLFKNNPENVKVLERMLTHFDIDYPIPAYELMGMVGGVGEDIQTAIAKEILVKMKWGGKNRDIYTKEIPELKGRSFLITDMKVCYTGVHVHGGGHSYSYYGECEYDPSYLGDAKAHRIFKLSPCTAYTNAEDACKLIESHEMDDLRIEDCYVKKVVSKWGYPE